MRAGNCRDSCANGCLKSRTCIFPSQRVPQTCLTSQLTQYFLRPAQMHSLWPRHLCTGWILWLLVGDSGIPCLYESIIYINMRRTHVVIDVHPPPQTESPAPFPQHPALQPHVWEMRHLCWNYQHITGELPFTPGCSSPILHFEMTDPSTIVDCWGLPAVQRLAQAALPGRDCGRRRPR